MTTIWRDPEVRRIRDFNRIALWHLRFMLQHLASGDYVSASHCEEFSRAYFLLARRQIKILKEVRRRQRRHDLIKTWILRLAVGLFMIQILIGILTLLSEGHP